MAKDVRVQFRLTPEEKRDFDAVCRSFGETPSAVLYSFVVELIRKNAERIAEFRTPGGTIPGFCEAVENAGVIPFD